MAQEGTDDAFTICVMHSLYGCVSALSREAVERKSNAYDRLASKHLIVFFDAHYKIAAPMMTPMFALMAAELQESYGTNLRRRSQRIEGLRNQAHVLLRTGAAQQALDMLMEADSLLRRLDHGTRAAIWKNISQVYSDVNEPMEALDAIEKANAAINCIPRLLRGGDSPVIKASYADMLVAAFGKGMAPKAIGILEAAIALLGSNPGNFSYFNSLGIALEANGDYERAIKSMAVRKRWRGSMGARMRYTESRSTLNRSLRKSPVRSTARAVLS
ncbi:hypothetical protein [uncultured Ruegeria sp.]|uniref:tetratricopeptide repeat protein n=1 Tax=uncultured Ruegeria sp. TaxID=259304 RepID=UPI002614F7FE|nr:hypothetical protein [uncultured Ruegeria sp.]